MEPKQKYRWRRGTVDPNSEHMELTCGDKYIPVARIAPPVDQTFTVEILIDEERTFNKPIIKLARADLNRHLVENDEPDPWKYVKHYSTTSSNRFSQVNWSYYPEGESIVRVNHETMPKL